VVIRSTRAPSASSSSCDQCRMAFSDAGRGEPLPDLRGESQPPDSLILHGAVSRHQEEPFPEFRSHGGHWAGPAAGAASDVSRRVTDAARPGTTPRSDRPVLNPAWRRSSRFDSSARPAGETRFSFTASSASWPHGGLHPARCSLRLPIHVRDRHMPTSNCFTPTSASSKATDTLRSRPYP